MNFQRLVDNFKFMGAVLSVERTKDGGYGDIRIVAANKKFVEFAEHPRFFGLSEEEEIEFEAGSLYDKYLPKTPDFEDKCNKAANRNKLIHSFLRLSVCDLLFELLFLPIDYEDDNMGYCIYLVETINVYDSDMVATSSFSLSDDVLQICFKLRGTNDFDATIKDVMQDIRKMCGSEVSTLMLVDESTGTYNVLGTSKADNSKIKTLLEYPNLYDIAMSWVDTVGGLDSIVVQNKKDLEYIKEINYPWYVTLEESKVDSIIIFPLRHNRKLLGFLWATNFDASNSKRIKDSLEFTTFFIAAEIASYIMVKQLEHVSYSDLLTGVKNSNAMNTMLDRIASGERTISEPYGIVFADINGLKRVNDEYGHQAGDILIKKAALVLQEVFIDKDIYRVGGDEFMIIVTGLNQLDFVKKVYELKALCSNSDNVCLAVGSMFNDNGQDIREVVKLADKEMYKAKEKYYQEHPEQRGRD